MSETIQDELRSPGFIHDDVSYRAADRIDTLEAALRETQRYFDSVIDAYIYGVIDRALGPSDG